MPANKTTSGEQDNGRVKMIVVMGTGRTGGTFATAFAKRTSHCYHFLVLPAPFTGEELHAVFGD